MERRRAGGLRLYTASRHEKRVAQHLGQREIEFYLPLYKAERRWADGSRVTLDLPLFPGYLFVHIRRSERSRVLGVPGALSVVGGTGGEPASLPDATIEALRIGARDATGAAASVSDRWPARAHPVWRLGGIRRHRGAQQKQLARGSDRGAHHAKLLPWKWPATIWSRSRLASCRVAETCGSRSGTARQIATPILESAFQQASLPRNLPPASQSFIAAALGSQPRN